jgi:NAD(P)H dehydrogenase (quinone)
MEKSILVTGATGNFGKAAINSLLKKGVHPSNISAFVREGSSIAELTEKGIQVKLGDYEDYASLVNAFKNVNQLLLVSSSDVVNRSKQQENAVNAAVEAGVEHILYTSFFSNNPTETSPIAFVTSSHLETEKLIVDSGLSYTIFKNNLYVDILPMFFGDQVLENGIYLPAGDTKAAFTLREDMAEAAANILLQNQYENRVYQISNTSNVSMAEAAQYLSAITGKPVSYTSPTPEAYIETLSNAGVPVEYVGFMASFAQAIQQGEFFSTESDLEMLLGRAPISLKQYLSQVYAPK